MTKKERKLLLVCGVLLALVLVVRVVPMARDYYLQGQEQIAQLQDRVARFQQLIADTEEWKEQAFLKEAEAQEYATWVFEGSNPNLIGTSVQRALRQSVEQAGFDVREMSLARYSYVDDWLKISQDMSITLEQHEILPFFTALSASKPKLFITTFDVSRNRRQYTGSITVTAFARVVESASTATTLARSSRP